MTVVAAMKAMEAMAAMAAMAAIEAMEAMSAFLSPYLCTSFFPVCLKISKCIFHLARYDPW